MNWQQALEIVVTRTKHEPYRALCADDHPDRDHWRARMVERATGKPVEYPSLARQAGNLAGAIGRAVGAIVSGEAVLVPDDVLAERRRICGSCAHHDPAADRCKLCGCWTARKQQLATESCPLAPPRWTRWEKPTDDDRPGS